MKDIRLEKVASVLVDYSVEVKPGDLVMLTGMTPAAPLLEALYRQVLRCGAHPFLHISLPGIEEHFLRHANQDQLEFTSPLTELSLERYNKYIRIMSDTNTRGMTSIDPGRQVVRSRANRPLLQKYMERSARGDLRGVLALFPTDAYAQDAEMSLSEYEDFVFTACLPDPDDPVSFWKNHSRFQAGWIDYLADKKTLRIVSQDTDISMRIEGRPFVNCAGTDNFPDGEIFTSPVEDSIEGAIRFSFPAIEDGREVEGIWLRFHEGKVVEASAEKGEDFLLQMLDTDEGSRYVGEVAIGTNQRIQRFTRNILFDEKIGGTCHLALGAGYPESGSKNRSAIHWDMICDLRSGGEIWADDVLIHQNGRFTFEPAAS